ncbi:MAG TPA: potassium channel protein [Vicinamibacterales bacterium]|jgi:voltage-gated potassium channel|nr:potassium channel protein [Vicinamibacterales bacterium]
MAERVTKTKGDHWLRPKGPGFAVALLLLVVAGGTLGYHVIEGWSLWHGFYVTILGITTVDLPPFSHNGEVFTVLLLCAGVGSALYTFTLLATVVVEGGLPKRLQRRKYERMLDQLKDHFIVCGYGRIGSIVSNQLQQQHVPYVVVERDPIRLQAAMDDGALAVEADASREEVLKRVGIERARGLIAAVGTDAENVYAVLSARVLRPDLYIVGRAETEDATAKLKRAGADRVISPYQIGAIHMAQSALRPAVVDFMALATSSESEELAMEQITVAATSTLAAKSILDANLRQRFGVIVVGIQRQDLRMDFNPEPDTTIRAGDKLVVLGRPESLKHLELEAQE